MDTDKSMAQLAYEAWCEGTIPASAFIPWAELDGADQNVWHDVVNAIQRAQYGPAPS
jgi:hypothetical protein